MVTASRISLLTNNTSSTISVHINRGDRTFAPRVAYPTGPGPHTIATGDLNGDRQPDVVTANGTSSPGGDPGLGGQHLGVSEAGATGRFDLRAPIGQKRYNGGPLSTSRSGLVT